MARSAAAGVKPPPPGTAGLRNWTVVLDSPEQAAAVRSRAESAGLAVADHDDDFLVRDPWEIGIAFDAGAGDAQVLR